MQKAWFYNEYGSLHVLQLGDFPLPKPGTGQILVKVRAAALNPVDVKRRKGFFHNNDSDFPAVPGCDMSGVVEEVGEGVNKFKKGDEVYSEIHYFGSDKFKQCGTLAHYTLVQQDLAAHKPKNLSFEEAASLPLALLTALQAFDAVDFQKGRSVFIVGGAGGVGSLAIQLAKNVFEASRIVSTCGKGKMEFVKSLGADLVVDYTKQSYEQVDEKFDFLLDTIGESMKSYVVGKEDAPIIDVAALYDHHPRAQYLHLVPAATNLERLGKYIEMGKLKAVIDPKSPYSFTDVVEAFKHQETGRARGKIVIFPID